MMTKNFKHIILSILFFSTTFSQEILFLSPSSGMQGANQLSVTLIASDVNFFDNYSFDDVYFDSGELDAYNETPLSSNTMEFDLDISADALSGYHTVYLQGGWESTISKPNAFNVIDNPASISFVVPDVLIAGENANVMIYGSSTNWNTDSEISFSGEFISINEVFVISETQLNVFLFVSDDTPPATYDLFVQTNGTLDYLEDGILVENPDIPWILSIEPSSSFQNQYNFYVDIIGQNTHWASSNYYDLSVSLGSNGVYVDFINVLSDTHIQVSIDVYSWADPGYRDVRVYDWQPAGTGYAVGEEIIIEDGFEIIEPYIESIIPSIGIRGQDELEITLVGAGFDFIDSYNDIHIDWISFFQDPYSTDISAYNPIIESYDPPIIKFFIDIYEYATLGLYDLELRYYTNDEEHNNVYGEDIFTVLSSNANVGCTSENACNYDQLAEYDDGSCYYSYENEGIYQCDGVTCIHDADGDLICDQLDYSLVVKDTEVLNFSQSVTVPIILETYTPISAIQFTVVNPSSVEYMSSTLEPLDGFDIVVTNLSSLTQFSIFSTGNGVFPQGYNADIVNIDYLILESLMNTDIFLDLIDVVIYDNYGNEIVFEIISGGSILFVYELSNDNLNIPTEFSLERCYPNPFNPSTNITFHIPTPSNVNINIYNINGQLIEALLNEFKLPGIYRINWDAGYAPSGPYFIKMTSDSFIETQKVMLVK